MTTWWAALFLLAVTVPAPAQSMREIVKESEGGRMPTREEFERRPGGHFLRGPEATREYSERYFMERRRQKADDLKARPSVKGGDPAATGGAGRAESETVGGSSGSATTTAPSPAGPAALPWRTIGGIMREVTTQSVHACSAQVSVVVSIVPHAGTDYTLFASPVRFVLIRYAVPLAQRPEQWPVYVWRGHWAPGPGGDGIAVDRVEPFAPTGGLGPCPWLLRGDGPPAPAEDHTHL